MISNNIEKYWSDVAQQLSHRTKDGKIIAGDNDLFYEYKRKVFLHKFGKIINWSSKNVLEYGCGPGGNLVYLSEMGIDSIKGIDISNEMLDLARKNTQNLDVELTQNKGIEIPMKDNSVDVTFTATVLQHNVDDDYVCEIISELCRVSSDVIILCEHTEPKRKKLHDHFVGRTMEFYKDQVCKNNYGFESAEYLDIQVSYYMLGAIRKLFNPGSRKEGEPLNSLSLTLQKMAFGITKLLDGWMPAKRDLTLMVFAKRQNLCRSRRYS